MLSAADLELEHSSLLSCAQCGDVLVAPEWSEHVSDRCVRHLWLCDACGYEFETSVFLRAQT